MAEGAGPGPPWELQPHPRPATEMNKKETLAGWGSVAGPGERLLRGRAGNKNRWARVVGGPRVIKAAVSLKTKFCREL